MYLEEVERYDGAMEEAVTEETRRRELEGRGVVLGERLEEDVGEEEEEEEEEEGILMVLP